MDPRPRRYTAPSRDILDASSLSTLVQMVNAGMGITLLPEMAIPIETRSAAICIARFEEPEPSRTIGMVWRNTSPLAKQLLQVAEVVSASAQGPRQGGWNMKPERG